jgi:hypothetical protein
MGVFRCLNEQGGRIGMKVDDEKVQVSGTIWFDKAARVFLGGDRIELLEKIQALGATIIMSRRIPEKLSPLEDPADKCNNN